MIELSGLSLSEMTDFVLRLGEPKYRAAQLYSWVQKGRDFSEMVNLPLRFRESLQAVSVARAVTIENIRVSEIDGTEKFLFRMRDGNCVEGVLMKYEYGCTLCISTQVGCRMGCRFCASTLDGCVRNLTRAEILGEVIAAQRLLEEKKERVHNIVLMGSGEPFDNYDEVVAFLRLVSAEKGLGIGMRHISLSTCGLVPAIRKFAEEQLTVTLSLSLHAPNDAIRKTLMPIANRYTIQETIDACKYYLEKTGRRIVFEYALIDGVNCETSHAAALAALLRNMQCHVNVIPLNSVPERNLKGVKEYQVLAFLDALKKHHISATRRREMGDDIEGACGQLRKKILREEQG